MYSIETLVYCDYILKSLRQICRSRMPRWLKVNSFLRLGLFFHKGGSKHFICLDTMRSGGIVSFFKLSRIRFRQLALIARLPGVKKL